METQTKTRISTKTLLLIGVSVLIIGGGIIAYYGYVPPDQDETAEGEIDDSCFNTCMRGVGYFNYCMCSCGGPCWGTPDEPDNNSYGCPSVRIPQTGQKVCSISAPCWSINLESGICTCFRRSNIITRLACGAEGKVCYCPDGEVFGGGTGP